MATKVTTTRDLKKLIRVKDAWLNSTGLELLFEIEGKEKFYEFSPAATCRLFEKCELITSWRETWRGPLVKFEYMITEEDSAETEMIFETFAVNFRLSQYDAICIAAHLMRDEILQESTDAIINNIKKSYGQYIPA